MPTLADVVQVLATHRGRYQYLDAFVDDIDEFRDLREIAVRPIPGS